MTASMSRLGVVGRIHPLPKLAWLLAVSVAVFVVGQPAVIWGIVLGLVLVGYPYMVGRSRAFRLTIFSTLGLFLLQALFYHQGRVLFDLWPGEAQWSVTVDGLLRGLRVSGRFLAIILASQVFVGSTDSSELAYSLMQAGVPYRFGFALVSALRMTPMFRSEGRTVYEAQLCRGVALDRGGLRGLLVRLQRFLLPLVVSALRRVDSLSISMEGRHFGRYRTRTFASPLHHHRRDYAAWGLLIFFIAIIAVL